MSDHVHFNKDVLDDIKRSDQGAFSGTSGTPGSDNQFVTNDDPRLSPALDDLTDVNAPAPNDNDSLTWDAATSRWVPAAVAGGAGGDLDDLGDVTIDAPADNEVLAYNSGDSEWKNQTPAEAGLAEASHGHALNDLSDVNAPAPNDNDSLTYDSASGKWVPEAVAGGGGGAPTDAQYVVLALDGDLSAERVLTAGDGIEITDGGADGNVTVEAMPDWERTVLIDEFISNSTEAGEVGELGWGYNASSMSCIDGLADHPGVIRFNTSSTNGNAAYLYPAYTSSSKIMDCSDMERIAFLVSVPTITSILAVIGFGTSMADDSLGTDGAFFSFNPATDADWQCTSRVSSADETTDSGVTVNANDWYLLEIVPSGSNVKFYINGVLIATHSTKVPTSTIVTYGARVKTNTNSARYLSIDWFRLVTVNMGNRWT